MWDFAFDEPLVSAVAAIAVVVFSYLLFRGPGWSWVLTVIVLLIVGAIAGVGLLWIAVNLLGSFDGPVSEATWWWVAAASAGIALAIWNLWYSRWWRKLIAALAIPLFVVTAVLGINAEGVDDPGRAGRESATAQTLTN